MVCSSSLIAADLFDPGNAAAEEVSRDHVDQKDRQQYGERKGCKNVKAFEGRIAKLLKRFVEGIHRGAPFESICVRRAETAGVSRETPAASGGKLLLSKSSS